MKPIPSKDRSTFKMLVAFVESGGVPTRHMLEFAERYAINIDEMRKQLKEHRIDTLYKLRVAGLL